MLWWLSFSDNKKNIGCCVVEATDPISAAQEAWTQGCNPGGEVMLATVPKKYEDRYRPHANKLFTDFDEIQATFGPCTKGTVEEIKAVIQAQSGPAN